MESKITLFFLAVSFLVPNFSFAQERTSDSFFFCRIISLFVEKECGQPFRAVSAESVAAIKTELEGGLPVIPSPKTLTEAEVQSMIDRALDRINFPQSVTVSSEKVVPFVIETTVYRSSSAQADSLANASARGISALRSDVQSGSVPIPASSIIGEFASGVIRTLTSTAATITNLFTDNLVATNATTTLLFADDLVATNVTSTNLTSLSSISSPFLTVSSTTATSTFAGAVGIGTTTPSDALTVAGNISVSNSDGAIVIGDTTGNARAVRSIDIQSSRQSADQVAKVSDSYLFGFGNSVYDSLGGGGGGAIGANNLVGNYAIAVGMNNTSRGISFGWEYGMVAVGYQNQAYGLFSSSLGASNTTGNSGGQYASAFGYGNTARGSDRPSAFGAWNLASNFQSSAFGHGNTASGNSSSAFGFGNTTSASGASAFGSNVVNSVANSTMIGPSNTAKITILSSGNVGIGSTSPTAQLTNTGTVRFGALGSAGASLVTDANGNLTVSSDERLKDVQGQFTRGLSDISALSPITYKWNQESGLETEGLYTGFSAQNVQGAIPEAVGTDSRGYLTLSDRPILAAVVNAIKELSTKVDALASSNFTYINEATIGVLNAGKIHIQGDVCVDGVCVTKEQFKAIFMQNGATVYGTAEYQGPAPVPDPVVIDASDPAQGPETVASSTVDESVEEVIPVVPDLVPEPVEELDGPEEDPLIVL